MNSIDLIKNAIQGLLRGIIVNRHSSNHARALNKLPVDFEDILICWEVLDVSMRLWLRQYTNHDWLVIQNLLLLKEFKVFEARSRQ